jgi:rubrerythrin
MPGQNADTPLRAPNPFLRMKPVAPTATAHKAEEEKIRVTLAPFRGYGKMAPPPPSVVEPLPVVEKPDVQPPGLAAHVPPPMGMAERLKQLNRNLPDGVHYEPLDANALRQLQSGAATPTPPPPELPFTPVPPTPFSEKTNALLVRLIQDERNSVVFYTHLAEDAPGEDIAESLKKIAEGCGQRQKTYGEMYQKLTGKEFTPKESKINTGIPFRDGVALALSEENKSVRALTDWLDSRPDSATAFTVQNIINKKIVNANLLSLLI